MTEAAESATRHCEHRALNEDTSCGAVAIFRVSRGRQYDAQDSCRRHLAATAEALAEGSGHPLTVTVLYVLAAKVNSGA
jgi:hypothetical protein